MGARIGNCGWSYMRVGDFKNLTRRPFRTKLQAYAQVFDLVEVNSTFYRIPKLGTAEKWREEADQVNKDFEFTVKVSQIITHKDVFEKSAFWAFEQMKEIARALRCRVLLFQSPASFKPSKENLEKARRFFRKIKGNGLTLVWEVRWAKDWTREIVKKLFGELEINQCVDPFRQGCFYSRDLVYYRLHGFGRPSMYNYNYSRKELGELAEKTKKEKKPVFVLFNNSYCYQNALDFGKLL